jgi:hypothetical protein
MKYLFIMHGPNSFRMRLAMGHSHPSNLNSNHSRSRKSPWHDLQTRSSQPIYMASPVLHPVIVRARLCPVARTPVLVSQDQGALNVILEQSAEDRSHGHGDFLTYCRMMYRNHSHRQGDRSMPHFIPPLNGKMPLCVP